MKKLKKLLLLFALIFSVNAFSGQIVVKSLGDSGTGTLRWAYTQALPGDTILIDVKGAIALETPITIDNTSDITLIGPYPKHISIVAAATWVAGESMFNINNSFGIQIENIGFLSGFQGVRAINVMSGGNAGSPIVIQNCLFEGIDNNGFVGGAISTAGNATEILNCSFVQNLANRGGAIYINSGGNTTVTNCTFWGNQSQSNGGVFYIQGSGPVDIIHCTFYENNSQNENGEVLSLAGNNSVQFRNNAGAGNSTTAQFLNSGGGSLNSNGGNVIKKNGLLDPIPWGFLLNDVYSEGVTPELRNTILEDGFGLKYFTIISSSSDFIDQGGNVGIPKDCRRAPRSLTGLSTNAPDAGACEYTQLRVTSIAGDNSPNSLGAALTTALDPVNYVEFDIPGLAPHIILTGVGYAVSGDYIIDGFSEEGSAIPGPAPEFTAGATPGLMAVHVRDGANVAVGFDIFGGSPNSTVLQGLRITGFENTAVYIQKDNTKLFGNEIGLTAGQSSDANGTIAVYVSSDQANIGGPAHWQRNVISGNGVGNISLASSQNRVYGNFIGISSDGMSTVSGSATSFGIQNSGSDNRIGGPGLLEGNVIGNHTSVGITENGASSSKISHNMIGVGYNGTIPLPNAVGISLDGGSSDIVIGGTLGKKTRNIISGNIQRGIAVFNTSNAAILGNYIGLDSTGMASVPSTIRGIHISGTSVAGVVIGGTDILARNYISGHQWGIHVHTTAVGATTTIANNYIGTNKTGTLKIPNSIDGIFIESGAATTYVGVVGAGNLISGNDGAGIRFLNASDHFVMANHLGLTATGNDTIGNGSGVAIEASSNIQVGGNFATGEGNVISGNVYDGVYIGQNSVNAQVYGNIIGMDVSGTTALGNTLNGIQVEDALNTIIGNVSPGTGNFISGQTSPTQGVGILLSNAGSGTMIQNNKIGSGVNGTDSISNVVGIKILNTHNAQIGALSGFENFICSNEIGVHVLSPNVTMHGNYVGVGPGGITTGLGNENGIVVEAPDFTIGIIPFNHVNVVSNNQNDGIFINGDLADNCGIDNCLIGTNGFGGAAGNGGNGIHIIDADNTLIGAGALNTINGSGNAGIFVEGTADNTNVRHNYIGYISGDPLLANDKGIEISNGPSSTTIGAPSMADGNTIVGSTNEGIFINNADFNTVSGNFIGIDNANSSGPNGVGIRLINSHNNDIGGSNIAGSESHNVISNNTAEGIRAEACQSNHIFGNFIGMSVDGTATAPNSDGIAFTNGCTNNLIGSSTAIPAFRNVISGNNNAGIFMDDSDTNEVQFNFIGVAIDGTAIGTQPYGIWIGNGSQENLIGGIHTDQGNIISGNANVGLIIDQSPFNYIQGNDIGPGSDQPVGISLTGINTQENEIGGTQLSVYGNEISENDVVGVEISQNAHDNYVHANFIGVNRLNTIPGSANQGVGVHILPDAGVHNLIGLSSPGFGNVISGNGAGVQLDGANGQYVQNNFIGTDTSGIFALGNVNVGVYLLNGANNNVIGGPGGNEKNLISGNNKGIQIEGAGTDNNDVVGNFIGCDIGGSSEIPNETGVIIKSGAQFNDIGQAGAGGSNAIGGNNIGGVMISNAANNNVVNNDIGVSFPNKHGIILDSTANNNTIGGTPAERNVISGNDSIGVFIANNSSGNTLSSNYIGLQNDGQTLLPNLIGVLVTGSTGNNIGNPVLGEHNVISGNDFIGVALEDGADNNFVQNNFIGTGSSGNSVFGGTENGVGIYVYNSSGNDIGGDWNTHEGNVICFNTNAGVWLDTSNNNSILGNHIGISMDGLTWLGNGTTGIRIENGSSGNNIGLATPGMNNVITDHQHNIHISQSHDNDIVHNYIGNNSQGNAGLISGTNNSAYGIRIDSVSTNNDIFGLNVISGNGIMGVSIRGIGTDSNTVAGNYIGVDVLGSTACSNDSINVFIGNGATNNIIGGIISDGNVIGGNCDYGVIISGIGSDNNQVSGNYVGVGADNVTTYNTGIAIAVDDSASFSVIGGGIAPDLGNFIPFTNNHAIFLGNRSSNNDVQGNTIGLFPVTLGNGAIGGAGVHMFGSDFNKIGAVEVNSDSANIITNAQVGVETLTGLFGNSSYGNAIIGNAIYNNAGLGIDQNGDGAIEPIDTIQWIGNNGDIDIPLILTAWNCGDNSFTHVGVETYTNLLAGYRIEFYSNINPDPTNHGEGETFLGDWLFDPDSTPDTLQIDLGISLPVGTIITSTITGNLGNTSEFSLNDTVKMAPALPVLTVVDELCLGAANGQIEIDAPEAHYFSVDSISWMYGYYGDTLMDLASGTYNVYAQYLNGCVLAQTVNLTAGTALPVDTIVSPDTCGLGLGFIEFDTIPTNLFGGSGDYIYSWNGGLSYDPNLGNYSLLSGNYDLVLYDTVLGCYSDTLSVFIPEINDVVDESFTYADFCPGNSALPGSVSTPGGYWMYGPDPMDGSDIDSLTGLITNAVLGTTYPVVYVVGQCDEADTILVTASNLDDATFVYDDLCVGTTPNYTVSTPGGWWAIAGGTGSIDSLDGTILGSPGTYQIIYTTTGTCPSSDTNIVLLYGQPAAPQILTTQTQYCQNDSLLAMYTVSDANHTFYWYDNASLNNPLASDTIYTPASIDFGNNYFYLISQDVNGCSSIADSVNYTLIDVSGLYAGQDMTVCIGSTVQLEGFGGITYQWDLSDQISGATDIADPAAVVVEPEEFVVSITNANGCVVTDTVFIDLLPADSCHVETYNAFSPNSDGVNDFWIIDGIEGYTENTVYIYNRWGDLIISIENYNNADIVWDGTNKNSKAVPAGTYFYVVEVYGKEQKEGNPVGWVQIVK